MTENLELPAESRPVAFEVTILTVRACDIIVTLGWLGFFENRIYFGRSLDTRTYKLRHLLLLDFLAILSPFHRSVVRPW